MYFSEFSDVIIKWRLNGLTTNVGTSKYVPMYFQWLITPQTIQMMTIGGIVLLRMKLSNRTTLFCQFALF